MKVKKFVDNNNVSLKKLVIGLGLCFLTMLTVSNVSAYEKWMNTDTASVRLGIRMTQLPAETDLSDEVGSYTHVQCKIGDEVELVLDIAGDTYTIFKAKNTSDDIWFKFYDNRQFIGRVTSAPIPQVNGIPENVYEISYILGSEITANFGEDVVPLTYWRKHNIELYRKFTCCTN